MNNKIDFKNGSFIDFSNVDKTVKSITPFDYSLNEIDINWMNLLNEKSNINFITNEIIVDLSDKSNKFLEEKLKEKLISLGFIKNDNIFYDFLKHNVSKICLEENRNIYEFILNFDESDKSGIFLLGIVEEHVVNYSEINNVKASINFMTYDKSKILNNL